jgi:hypothetical protein
MTTRDTPEAALRWALNRAEQRELEALAELDEAKAEIARLTDALWALGNFTADKDAESIRRFARAALAPAPSEPG